MVSFQQSRKKIWVHHTIFWSYFVTVHFPQLLEFFVFRLNFTYKKYQGNKWMYIKFKSMAFKGRFNIKWKIYFGGSLGLPDLADQWGWGLQLRKTYWYNTWTLHFPLYFCILLLRSQDPESKKCLESRNQVWKASPHWCCYFGGFGKWVCSIDVNGWQAMVPPAVIWLWKTIKK